MISAASWSTRKSPPLIVSKVCHSQLSSSTLASAAHMPPWAAPVCERVGYSLVSTAVRARWPDSMAARIPAPPAPTMTTSYLWTCMLDALSVGTKGRGGRAAAGPLPCAAGRSGGAEGRQQLRGGAGRARIEGEDHQRAQDDDDGRGDVEDGLQRHARAILLRVVVDDGAHAVGAVQHRQPQHRQVPDLPERIRPLAADEAEVDRVHALADHQVDDQVAEDQHHQHNAGQAHEEPGEHL